MTDDEIQPFVDFLNRNSKYYTDRHKRFFKVVDKFMDDYVMKKINKWEKKQETPRELYKQAYDAGVFAYRYPAELGGTPFEGQAPDHFMDLILADRLMRGCTGGLFTSLFSHYIAVPPVLYFGSDYVKKLYGPVIRGEKISCLAISESKFGSDVSGIETTAVKSACGQYYIVNGSKMWISNGLKSDVYTTLVRTGSKESRHKGLSFLAICRDDIKDESTDGKITVARVPTQGHWISETAQIFFKDVRVPVKNLIGIENKGFYHAMANFNKERLGMAGYANALSKQCILLSIDYARSRIVFGKPLIKSQVIRHKIAQMAAQYLSALAFTEQVSYQMDVDPLGKKDKSVGYSCALAKVRSTQTLEYCAREATQIFGGKGYVLGSKIDRIYRDTRALVIYGGSEEILIDASTRLAKL